MNDAWAVARDAILRWDGTSWKAVYHHAGIGGAEPELFGIWVTKHDDVWALARGALIRYSARDGGAPDFANTVAPSAPTRPKPRATG